MSTALRTYYRGHDLTTLVDSGGSSRYYHYDHQGTTQCLTDSTGAVTDRLASDAWSVEVKRTGSSINRQWYIGGAGYYRDVGSSEYYVRMRYLAAQLARWNSRDPLRYSRERYGYARNRPAFAVDPGGLLCRVPTEGCVGCGPLPCDQCTLKLPAGCTTTNCPEAKCDLDSQSNQAKDLCLRLRYIMGAVPTACSGGQPTGGTQVPPYAYTYCCAHKQLGGIGCDSRTACLVCPGQRTSWDELKTKKSCLLKCLYEHEKMHRGQCRDNKGPDECDPWRTECGCVTDMLTAVLVDVAVADPSAGDALKRECCGKSRTQAACDTTVANYMRLLDRIGAKCDMPQPT